MRERYDVIVIGLGAMGSAAAFHLARRGRRVLGIDRYAPPHAMGSSHGQTRIIREAYFEHPAYVPLVRRAYELWDELERESLAKLFLKTGGLMIGRPESALVAGALRSAETHRLPYEMLSSAELSRRFQVLRPEPDMVAVYEPRAGILFPEACVSAHLALAARHGAVLKTNEPVMGWRADRTGVSVTTSRATHRARSVIVAAGAWARELLADLNPPLTVERQVVFWFDPLREPAGFSASRCPIHLWQLDDERFFYGFPDLGEGVKVARHYGGSTGTPDTIPREATQEEAEGMRDLLARYVPDAAGELHSASVCLYTNTPDGHFWIDRHPAHANVLIASPCSGHGFKFSSVIGEVLADLATGRTPGLDLALFRNRWAP
jgi:sarcosine oxidase